MVKVELQKAKQTNEQQQQQQKPTEGRRENLSIFGSLTIYPQHPGLGKAEAINSDWVSHLGGKNPVLRLSPTASEGPC